MIRARNSYYILHDGDRYYVAGGAYFPNVAVSIAAGGEENGAGACGACTPMPSLRRELFERFQGVDGELVS